MASHNPLTKRQEAVLDAVVRAYIANARPVGSRMLVRQYGFGVSPATVRNTMADLEEMGYLKRWHVSSGRVPTDAGYKYYVDLLLNFEPLTYEQRLRIDNDFRDGPCDLPTLLERTSKRLAFESHCAGVVKGPQAGRRRLSQLELVRLAPKKLLVVLIDNLDTVHNYMAMLDQPLSRAQVGEVTDVMNALLCDESPDGTPRVTVEEQVNELRGRLADISPEALAILDGLPLGEFDGKIYIDGTSSILEQPEYRDPAMSRAVLNVLMATDQLSRLLQKADVTREGVMFLIGGDTDVPCAADISVVIAPYRIGDHPVGALGVIGPRRMHYDRAASLVNYTSQMLSEVLTESFGSSWSDDEIN
ncbi:MAG: heat-inducible transcription repressor HrcA [Candidatus Hydrogenedentes bacterium]|nr:heat-inducible transcription repressor HrcA [Candidatus Hydrogenedentota bacterium]